MDRGLTDEEKDAQKNILARHLIARKLTGSGSSVVAFRPEFKAMTGTTNAALLLSQIMYWHTPRNNGKTRLTHKQDGFLWLAKTDREWLLETGLSVDEVRNARRILEDRLLIISCLGGFAAKKCTVYRINWVSFNRAEKAALNGDGAAVNYRKRPRKTG